MAKAVQVEMLLAGLCDASGEPLSGGKIYHYAAGTTTDKDMWTTYSKSATVAQPLILDASGKATAYAAGAYKFEVKDANDVTLYTHDNLFYQPEEGVRLWGGTSSGAANAYAISPSPGIYEYETGQIFRCLTHQANTSTTPTLAVSGLSTKTIVNMLGGALFSGEIPNGCLVDFVYDGTNMRMLPVTGQWQSWTPTYGGEGAMTYTSVTTSYGKFRQDGKSVEFQLRAVGTTGGTASEGITFTLPVVGASASGFNAGAWVGDTGGLAGYALNSSASTIVVRKYNSSNYGLGATRTIGISGSYEVA